MEVSTGGKHTLLEDGNGVNQQSSNRMESDDKLKQKQASELEALTKEKEEDPRYGFRCNENYVTYQGIKLSFTPQTFY
jgi:hypothetical protein